MKSVKVGVASDQEIRQRMLDIASGRYIPAAQEPKIWVRSVDELCQLVDEGNVNLLNAPGIDGHTA